MIYKAILLALQKFLWSKVRGGVRSKILFIIIFLVSVLLLGGLFSSFYLNIPFLQGVWWMWGYMISVFVKVDQFFSSIWDTWRK